jgi:YVTN family beta-propeller protein
MDLSEELVRMAEGYCAVRAALATDGSGFENYDPMMAKLQRRNAERLNEIINDGGWSGRELIGGVCWAPMLLLHNMIGSPKVMRRGLGLLRAAERRGEVDPAYVAVLEDQILTLEGKPQQYGTHFDWDDDGELNPLPIANLGGDTVSVIDTSNNTVTSTIDVGDTPIGVTVSPDGARVYVTNAADDTVSVITLG